MRFAALGSGSRGNATLVESGSTRVLIDCGLSAKVLTQRLDSIDVEPGSIAALLLTHEHGDHIGGVAAFAGRYGIPVWSTPGTWRAANITAEIDLRLFLGHGGALRIGDFSIAPFPIPHDAREPCQFVIDGDGCRLGVLTDAGNITPHIRERLSDCDALMLEANHDPALLRAGPYPPSVQTRVGGAFGHLSNQQAAELLDRLEHRALRQLLIAHVSANNNREDLVRSAMAAVSADLEQRLVIAPQSRNTGWLQI
ncbi:MBL fold metallo-hydrolase [Lamprobacter modestohalophilus]|uniref:MBL fold metallo-hydrolase n=1 Tax=Lamprobacter modestohalophilus TaxID=1064514 RepID=UPI002ADEDD78|nr:MBL fold metallo-hydrolase [Lamprobacter modestohalophilus]MEA1050140.1 MBL fold metallo-hydrolase [Lamprobacter modestohalophilus]